MNKQLTSNNDQEEAPTSSFEGGEWQPLFDTFFLAGFECSTHRLLTGRRLDLIGSTKHDKFARQDYARLRQVGIEAARDGLRWHLIEKSKGLYDFSSVLPMLRAAREKNLQIIWDIFHYGWPEHIDIFKPAFVDRLARFAREFVKLHSQETDRIPFLAPTNENSYFAWAGGELARMYPGKRRRGGELKEQLVRACIAVAEAVWDIDPRTRLVHTDPIINVVGNPRNPRAAGIASAYNEAQYQNWDMISGRLRPELGGHPKYLDVIGINYYPHNQWMVANKPDQVRPYFLTTHHPSYRPLRRMLSEVQQRYGRPVFVAETGTEGTARPSWFRYVCDEVAAAIDAGVRIEGVCLYPIVNHPGWINNRHCHNALWDYADQNGEREIYAPLAEELERQIRRFEVHLRPLAV
jgi:beta-glucosidase/6-phospho-beta-glucosidase/beta-galactosidase